MPTMMHDIIVHLALPPMNSLIKFPKYSREENRACKLLDAEIKEIQWRGRSGESYKELAEYYGVSRTTIYYWCLSDERRAEYGKKRREATTPRPYDPAWYKEYRKRKKEVKPELIAYERQWGKELKEKRPNYEESLKKASKKYYWTHRDVRRKKDKKYQLANLDKFRAYNKKRREKDPERVRELQRAAYHRNRDKIIARRKELRQLKNTSSTTK